MPDADRGDAGRGVPLVRDPLEMGRGIGKPHHCWDEVGVSEAGDTATHIAYPKAIALAQMSVVEAVRVQKAACDAWNECQGEDEATGIAYADATSDTFTALDALDQAQRDSA